jgi:hypothetical protein
VSTDGTAVVAGRSAYELVLQPRDARSLVDSVRIAIDGTTHLPTRVQIYAVHASKPAFEVGFTSFNPGEPPASMFRFNPPPHTKVTSGGTPKASAAPPHGDLPGGRDGRPEVVGKGWTSVVVARVPAGVTDSSSTAKRLLAKLPTVRGSWGSGHLLRGTLFSAVLTDDGRGAVGAVAPEVLYRALTAR